MFQVRFHGRGGQGVVTAADLLAYAAFKQGAKAQSFPSFGSERTGAPVVSYCRIERDKPIRVREPILEPDALIIQDATLLTAIDVFDGLKPDGYALINTTHSWEDLGVTDKVEALPPGHALRVPATELAIEHLGRPLPNAVMLGAFCAIYEPMQLESLVAAIHDRFAGRIGDKNADAATAAYESVTTQNSELTHA